MYYTMAQHTGVCVSECVCVCVVPYNSTQEKAGPNQVALLSPRPSSEISYNI